MFAVLGRDSEGNEISCRFPGKRYFHSFEGERLVIIINGIFEIQLAFDYLLQEIQSLAVDFIAMLL